MELVAFVNTRDCPYTPKLHGAYYDQSNIYLKMDYCQYRDLSLYEAAVRADEWTFTDQLINRIFVHVLTALDCLHSNGLQHMDVAARNILIANDNSDAGIVKFVLTDFGKCKKTESVDFEYDEYLEDIWRLGVVILVLKLNIQRPPELESPLYPDNPGIVLSIVKDQMMIPIGQRAKSRQILQVHGKQLKGGQMTDAASLEQAEKMSKVEFQGTPSNLVGFKGGDNEQIQIIQKILHDNDVKLTIEKIC